MVIVLFVGWTSRLCQDWWVTSLESCEIFCLKFPCFNSMWSAGKSSKSSKSQLTLPEGSSRYDGRVYTHEVSYLATWQYDQINWLQNRTKTFRLHMIFYGNRTKGWVVETWDRHGGRVAMAGSINEWSRMPTNLGNRHGMTEHHTRGTTTHHAGYGVSLAKLQQLLTNMIDVQYWLTNIINIVNHII